MKFKYYLRGFGTGVLFATIICMIGMAIHNNLASNQKIHTSSSGNVIKTESKDNKNSKDNKATDENNKGSETEDEQNKTETTQNITTTQNETTTNIETTAQNETTTKIESPDVTTEGVASGENMPQDTTDGNMNDSGDTVTLVIESGMISNEVARLLEEYGVVESGYDFNMYMYNNGYESRLRVGTYEIRKGASYSEIVTAITR